MDDEIDEYGIVTSPQRGSGVPVQPATRFRRNKLPKKIIFIHGRLMKPSEEDLRALWFDAVSHGLRRDFGKAALEKFAAIEKSFVYYGDLSNEILSEASGKVIPVNTDSRLASLEKLKNYRKSDFNKVNYNRLAKLGFVKEALADLFSGVLSVVRAGTPLISAMAPDMVDYWDQEGFFGKEVHARLTDVLKEAFDNDKEIMLVAHSLGTVICYDNLWHFTHGDEYRHDYGARKKVDLFVTLGSPLGDENAKQNLRGKEGRGSLRYPHNIRRWINFSAEDDYVSHDRVLNDDFHAMYQDGLLEEPIIDIHPLYNLTVHEDVPTPHSAMGYLMHPKFIDLLSEWMDS